MRGLDGDALDRHIAGGHYSSAPGWVVCPGCGERHAVLAESEYGATTWSPEECKGCGRAYGGDEPWEDDEPDEEEEG